MTVTLLLADALAALPTHAARMAHAEQTAALTGAFPWGLADPADLTQDPAASAALLLAQRQRAIAGLPPVTDLMSAWSKPGSLAVRESIGPTVTLAWVGRVEWMVCRFGRRPITGKVTASGRRDVDEVLLRLGYALLDVGLMRFSTTQAAQVPQEPV